MSSYGYSSEYGFYQSFSWKKKEAKSRFWYHKNEVLPVVELDDSYFQNSSGCYRVGLVRSAYFSNAIDVDRVVDLYKKWRDNSEYMFLDGVDSFGRVVTTAFAKCSKRGNDVYKARVREKFKDFKKLPDIDFLSIFDGKTPMLFITLDVNQNMFTIDEAWKQLPEYLHRFEASLRQKYGSFEHLRSFEAHKNGYPHIHLLIYFKDFKFITFKQKRKKDGKIVERVANKHNSLIHHFWNMGSNVDVLGVGSTKGFFSEIVKYITKDVFTSKAVMTNAMVWLFRKRQFSLSKNFLSSVFGDIGKQVQHPVEPGGSDLVNVSVHNCNKEFPEIVDWKFKSTVSKSFLEQLGINLEPDGKSLWYGNIDLTLDQRILLGFDSVGDL